MKKIIICFTVLFLCSNLNLFAQVVSYTFRDSTGIYNEINSRAVKTDIKFFILLIPPF